jgi:dienelactone hydrolase
MQCMRLGDGSMNLTLRPASRKMRRISTFAASFIIFVIALGVEPQSAVATDTTTAFSDACAQLPNNNGIIRSAGSESAAFGPGKACVVRGKITSSATSIINFRVDLPDPAGWNGKVLMIGGAGFDGFVPTDAPNHLGFWSTKLLGSDADHIAGYVIASSDSGHQGRGQEPIGDFSWVSENHVALVNHAYQANHIVLVVTTDLSRQLYGKNPERRYIIGGSNGGRAGLVAIQHYPEDYDGVLALEPAISQEGFAANLGPQMLQHIFASPDNWLDKKHIELYEQHELAACDQMDGLNDGILSNVQACNYDGKDLLCKVGAHDLDACLSPGQVESIRLIHLDKNVNVTLADNWIGYAGYGRGGESSDWEEYLFGPSFAAREAADYGLADNIVKWGITNDPNSSVMTHDPTQWAKQYRALSDEIDATNPNLLPFYRRGGKLIVWYGTSDACVSYRQTAKYIQSVRDKLGERTNEFLRFYISPATGHNMAGAGAITAPLLSALEDWVEKGQAPGSMTATLGKESADPNATRPLCEYPLFPRYKGGGDAHSASSFECSSH